MPNPMPTVTADRNRITVTRRTPTGATRSTATTYVDAIDADDIRMTIAQALADAYQLGRATALATIDADA